jgi:hypothetical protein
MKWPFAALLALGLVGCVESGNFEKEKPMQLAVPTEPNRSPTKPIPREPWTARAKALNADTNENAKSASLMECVSEACKIQCSAGLEKDSRPKWCLYFKEPIDRHASEMQGKSTE